MYTRAIRESCDIRYWVYAVRILESGLIKIGRTRSICNRVSSLKLVLKTDIELIGIMPGGCRDEYRVHQSLVGSHADHPVYTTEVYHPTKEVIDLILSEFKAPEHYFGAGFNRVNIYKPCGDNRARITIESVNRVTNMIKRATDKGVDQHFRISRLQSRVKNEHKQGHDMSQAIAIIKDRLGLEIAV